MTMTPNETARLLIEALPYIRRFTGKTIIVKVGGLPMTDPARARSLAKDILLLHSVGIRPVLVHGGGPQIDEQMARQGKTVERIDGLRVTDAEALDIVRMVLVGKINPDLVAAINREEPVAVGVSGRNGDDRPVYTGGEEGEPALQGPAGGHHSEDEESEEATELDGEGADLSEAEEGAAAG